MANIALPDQITVVPWADNALVHTGHDPRSSYVEDYWLGLIGPSATWILRRIATAFDHDPDGFVFIAVDLAAEVGLGRGIGANAPFTRTIGRLELFDLVRRDGDLLHARRRVPELTRRQLSRLPEHLGRAHDHHRRLRDGEPDIEGHRRARRLAMVLAECGDRSDVIESRLHSLRVPPEVAVEASNWAAARIAHPSYTADNATAAITQPTAQLPTLDSVA